MSRPGVWTYVRDTAVFVLGLVIVLKQAGIGFPPPPGGPAIELIILGGLFCNGPVMLQALALRSGTGSSSPQPVSSGQQSPPEPSSAPSSGGN